MTSPEVTSPEVGWTESDVTESRVDRKSGGPEMTVLSYLSQNDSFHSWFQKFLILIL